MAVISLKNFTGEVPRIPAHLLPDNAAQTTMSCNFAYGELCGIKEAQVAATITGVGAPKAIWTEDGVNFYAWTANAEVALSPIISDTHKRLYYTVGDGLDIGVVAMKGDYHGNLPISAGINPSGYRVGVPGPANLSVFGETALNSGISNSALYARLVNYDAPVDPADLLTASGYSWAPVIKGLRLRFIFFYEHNGVKYQETEILNVYDGTAIPSGNFVVLQQSLKYAGTEPNNINERIYGRDFHVAHPAKEMQAEYVQAVGASTDATRITVRRKNHQETEYEDVEVVDATVKTPATTSESKPTLQVIGSIDGEQVFSVYSEGSFFSSSRGAYGAKLYSNKAVGADVLYCGLKYGINETRAYVYTNVNIFGEESKPSDPVTVDVEYGQTVELYGTFKQVASYAPIKSTRSYGTNTTSQGNTDWYFMEEGGSFAGVAPGSSVSFSGPQAVRPENYGERLSTQDYDLPPEGATGLCALPNGILACFRNTAGGSQTGQNEVCFSEPYHPSAWPAKYVQTFPWDVVAIKPQGNGLVVVTKGQPYYVYGTHPDSMSAVKLQAMQAGVSKRAICDIGSHVIYASHDGLVSVQNTDVNIEMSQKFFTREKWRALYGANLSGLCLAYHDGMLIGYFTQATVQGFVIRFDEAAGTFTRTVTQTVAGSSHCTSQLDDKLYFFVSQTIKAFASGTTQQAYEWRSKDFILPAPVCMAGGQIILDDGQSGTVTIKVYADGALKNTTPMTASGYFRLPAGFMARKWSVSINAGRTVKELYLTTSMKELAGV